MRMVRWFGGVLILTIGASAYAADDCCWDWSPKETGKADGPPNEHPWNNPDTKYAICSKRATKGPSGTPQDSPCFARKGRQMVWQDWVCLKTDEESPDGKVPPDPSKGFYCQDKATGIIVAAQLKGEPPTAPPNGPSPGDVDTEGKGIPLAAPAVTSVGLAVLVLAVIVGGAWLFRRQRVAGVPTT